MVPEFDCIYLTFDTRYTKALDAIKNLRKERVAELKVDKERLERLSGEKSHADKLRSRIVELGQLISKKQVEYEETKGSHDALTIANTKLYEYSHKFRKVFDRADALEKQRERYQQDLAEAKETTEEIRGMPTFSRGGPIFVTLLSRNTARTGRPCPKLRATQTETDGGAPG